MTYEYQCRVQILFIFLHEFLVVHLGLLAIMFIELGAEILLRKLPALFLPVRGVNDGGRRNAKLNLHIRRVSVWFPTSISLPYSSVILATIEGQRAVTLCFL